MTKNSFYASDIVNDNWDIHEYNPFRYRQNNMQEDLMTKSEYASIGLALRWFDALGINPRISLTNIDPFINLSNFLGDRNSALIDMGTKTIWVNH